MDGELEVDSLGQFGLGQWQGWRNQVLTKFWRHEFSGHCYANDILECAVALLVTHKLARNMLH